MNKEEIFLSDWQRILIGNTPWEFMAEVAIRSIVMFLVLLLVLRLLGKRMSAQLTVTELAVMVTLGAIISVPMQLPDRGILPALVFLCGTFIFQRGLNFLAFKNHSVEIVTQGDVVLLVKNGRLQIDQMRKSRVSRDQLFSQLRSQNIQHLGQVKRTYLEACGIFSVFKNDEPEPGLSIIPDKDKSLLKQRPGYPDYYSCQNCGNTEQQHIEPQRKCRNCGEKVWKPAHISIPVTAD